ncbi:MAG: hypothetical protein FD149_1499 [Rhodospirillaceae bacterium]|nr:MAG: hypothetical protein FD149_1499 [Rhodospirillaceae bacterium]
MDADSPPAAEKDTRPMPTVWTIAPERPFVDTLAAGLRMKAGPEPLQLARMTVLLPNRRTCLALREAFLRTGQPLLLPRLSPIGDADGEETLFFTESTIDLWPALPPVRRQLLLTRLILAGQKKTLTPDQAARLAAALTRFLDAVQRERLGFDPLAALAPDDYAEHWQITLDFLTLLTNVWPSVLAAEKRLDPMVRRDRALQAVSALWQRQPPPGPVVVAGIIHADPAMTDLIRTVITMPEEPGGCIVLPALDRILDAESWEVLEETHPQAGLKALLAALGVARHEVADWPAPAASAAWITGACASPDRLHLITEALRPAATTDRWQHLLPLAPQALVGVERIDCPTPREEAQVIALLLREALEYAGRTAALVTPDRTLARRVAIELERWGIEVDDSSGVPLAQTPPGIFLRLTAAMVTAAFAPLPLLEVLKHPLAAAGHAPEDFRPLARRLEARLLRGPRPASGIAGLWAALEALEPRGSPPDDAVMARGSPLADDDDDVPIREFLVWLEAAAAPFTALMQQEICSFTALIHAHMAFAEALATSAHQPGAHRLWQHDAGVVAADFVTDLLEGAEALPHIAPRFYSRLLQSFMEERTVRPSYGRHPRLFLWGPLEARLQQPDLLILGGLNEGTWPPTLETDPWMSRPMRVRFGLPPLERRIGLSAHDFMHAFCAPRVVLTRSERVEGTPTVPSRWLLRLEAVLHAAGLHEQAALWGNAGPWLAWARGMDWPQAFETPRRPAPRPPVAVRPSRLSVTEVETWMRDPYALYARHVLRLRALPPLDADPEAADYGTLVHKTLEIFLKTWSHALPPDPEATLLAVGGEVFARVLDWPGVWAFWWPRFTRIARWIVRREHERRQPGTRILAEATGRMVLPRAAGLEPFRLTAKADRIEIRADGRLVLIDYKTGQVPSPKEIAAGYAPQLPLEAALARRGGFSGLPAGHTVAELLYWRLSGTGPGGEEKSAGKDADRLAEEAFAGVRALIAAFDRPETPYEARPHPVLAPRYSDYQHLARIKEWAAGGPEEAE